MTDKNENAAEGKSAATSKNASAFQNHKTHHTTTFTPLNVERLLSGIALSELAGQAGAKLHQTGRELRGPCPLHKGDNCTAFSIYTDNDGRELCSSTCKNPEWILQCVAAHLSCLPETLQSRYFNAIERKFDLSRRDIKRLMEQSEPGADLLYSEVKEGRLHFMGEPLGNFWARISHELIVDDGLNPPTVRYSVEGGLTRAKEFWRGLDENLDIMPDALRRQLSQVTGILIRVGERLLGV